MLEELKQLIVDQLNLREIEGTWEITEGGMICNDRSLFILFATTNPGPEPPEGFHEEVYLVHGRWTIYSKGKDE